MVIGSLCEATKINKQTINPPPPVSNNNAIQYKMALKGKKNLIPNKCLGSDS